MTSEDLLEVMLSVNNPQAAMCIEAMTKVGAAVMCAALAAGPFPTGSAEELSLRGKTIGVTVIGTDHHWDFMAFRGQVETLERLGGRAIALDAHRSDQTQIIHIRSLIAKRPHAILEQLGNIDVLDPWLKRIRDAGIPLFTVDTVTEHAINNTTSNNYGIGSDIALQIAQDMHGEGKVLVFNGFYTVPVCKIRYERQSAGVGISLGAPGAGTARRM